VRKAAAAAAEECMGGGRDGGVERKRTTWAALGLGADSPSFCSEKLLVYYAFDFPHPTLLAI
jgi:hypothetical protein